MRAFAIIGLALIAASCGRIDDLDVDGVGEPDGWPIDTGPFRISAPADDSSNVAMAWGAGSVGIVYENNQNIGGARLSATGDVIDESDTRAFGR